MTERQNDEKIQRIIEVPQGVKAEMHGNLVRISGRRGKIERTFERARISMELKGGKFIITADRSTRREKAIVGTWEAHIKNMIQGVTEGFEYRMKFVYAHFPIKLTVKGNELIIENFLGEKKPRKARILQDVKVIVKGNEVVLVGNDIEKLGITAANIERATKIKDYDPRVFQDGIFITAKAQKPSE
ncbi:MAG: 50S ribosomal protein L6 [Thermoplasmata archaeon]|nr:50S ribosomal protein L6 [Thermoplasmata archaeon]